jgi:signal transduction histidine kinase/CheY-like chemotaxis protein
MATKEYMYHFIPRSITKLRKTVLKSCSLFVFSIAATILALEMGGGPPSLFWPTNGLIICFLIEKTDLFSRSLILMSGSGGIAVAQFHIIDKLFAFKLGLASGCEIICSILLMDSLREKLKDVHSFSFIFFLLLCVSGINCVVGATIGSFVVKNEFKDADFLQTWVDWYIGDITGNFIVVQTWLIVRKSILEYKNEKKRDIFNSMLKHVVDYKTTCIGLVILTSMITIYSLENITPTIGIPIILLTTSIIASMGLSFSYLIVSFVNICLVIAITVGTRNRRGPIYSVFRNLSDRDIFICVEMTLLATFVLSSILSVVRHKNLNQKEQLKYSYNQKETFFSHISHELRTPLNIIMVSAENTLTHEEISQSVRLDMQNIMDASVSMAATVNDLLTIFRPGGQELHINNVVVNVSDFVNSISSVTSSLAKKKNINFKLDIDDRVPGLLIFDPHRISQVLLNVIGNSVKYTPSFGNIDVNINYQCDENKLIVQIKDTGIGIKKEDIPFLLDRFFRCDHNTDEQGTGLGLTICNGIMTSIGGDIKFESIYGSGTTVKINIPVKITDIESSSNISTDKLTPSEILNSIRVLVVEDSKLISHILVRMLERSNFIVDCAYDGISATQKALEGIHNIILLDLGLPKKTGIDVLREIRMADNENVKNIPVIITSGDVKHETRIECLKEGCTSFVDKPYSEKLILETILKELKIE